MTDHPIDINSLSFEEKGKIKRAIENRIYERCVEILPYINSRMRQFRDENIDNIRSLYEKNYGYINVHYIPEQDITKAKIELESKKAVITYVSGFIKVRFYFHYKELDYPENIASAIINSKVKYINDLIDKYNEENEVEIDKIPFEV